MIGNISSRRAPAAYRGCCGPGTLVTAMSYMRRVRPCAARALREFSVGGANPRQPDQDVRPDRSAAGVRGHGVTHPRVPAARIGLADGQVDQQCRDPPGHRARRRRGRRCSPARARARVAGASSGSPRESSQPRSAPVTTARIASCTVPPRSARICRKSASSARATAIRRCWPRVVRSGELRAVRELRVTAPARPPTSPDAVEVSQLVVERASRIDSRTVSTSAAGRRTTPVSASATSRVRPGARSGTHNASTVRRGCGDSSSSTWVMSMLDGEAPTRPPSTGASW